MQQVEGSAAAADGARRDGTPDGAPDGGSTEPAAAPPGPARVESRGGPGERPSATPFERVHRPADLLYSLVAVAALTVVLALFHGLPAGSAEVSRDVARWLGRIPYGITFALSFLVSIGALVLSLVVTGVLLRREARGALNAGLAAALGAAAAIVAATIWNDEHGAVNRVIFGGRNPWTFVADAAFLAFLTATDLVRRPRWWRWCVLSAAALLVGDMAVGNLAPLAAVVVLLGGVACGWLIRWALGAASLRPTVGELRGQLGRYGLAVAVLTPNPAGPPGALQGSLEGGEPIDVRVANRDTRGTGTLRAFWAVVRLRPMVAGHPTLSSRSELERLALAAHLAEGAGVVAPRARLLTEVSGESLVLVVGKPGGRTLSGDEPVEVASGVFAALRRLHQVGVAHRLLRAESLTVAEGGVGFSSLDAALPGASELVRRLDVTQLLVTLARLLGAETAVAAMRDGYRPADEEAIVAILQPIALAPWGWSAMREARGSMEALRRELAGPGEVVAEVRLERFRWRTVVSAVALTIAAYVLVGQLSTVNLIGAIRQTSLGWFALALAGSVVTYFAAAANLAAFVPRRPSLVRGFFVQLASAFVGVAMPPTVGHVAVNARYLHRRKVPDAAIAAAVALSQITNVVTTLLLLLVIGLLTGSGISRFKIVPSTDVLLACAAAAGLAGILLLIPRYRSLITHRIWPRLYSVWPRLLEALSQPLRLVLGMGADVLLIAGYALAFVASIRAMGGHAPILLAVAVYLAGNAVGTAAPTPGGLGAVETVLAAGLTGIGVPAGDAIPAVLVFRLATFWLPIPAGWISFVVLQRRGVL